MKRLTAGFLPPIALDETSDTPMYQQVSNWFRQAIMDGRLRPGQRVPSTRQLAHELHVSRIPLLSAYEQLHAEGYLESFVGAGTCVARSITQGPLKPVVAKLPVRTGRRASRKISRRVAALRTPASPWLKNLGAFRVGLPALEHFPFRIWSKLVNRYSRKPTTAMMTYGEAMGHLPLRETIAEYLGAFRGVRCEASQILVTNGSQQGLQICAQVLLDFKDRV